MVEGRLNAAGEWEAAGGTETRCRKEGQLHVGRRKGDIFFEPTDGFSDTICCVQEGYKTGYLAG